MDTKSKKWKCIVSFGLFFAGITLIITTAANFLNGLSYGAPPGDRIRGALSDDYQVTGDFRWIISGYLENFIRMATGGPLVLHGVDNFSWDFSDFYEDAVLNDSESSDSALSGDDGKEKETTYQVEAVAAQSSETAGSEWETASAIQDVETAQAKSEDYEDNRNTIYTQQPYFNDGRGYKYYYDGYTQEENRKAADRMNEYLKENKNLLYRVVYDDQVLFENTEEALNIEENTIPKLPEGYNFMLYFDGSAVRVIKDNGEENVYGDGYYTESSQWYVPGYRNFTADQDFSKVRVYILAAKEPILFIHSSKNTGGGYEEQKNDLYEIAKQVHGDAKAMRGIIISLLIAAACLSFYAIWRSDKKEADRLFAGVMGKIWFEPKVMVLFLLAAGAAYANIDTFQELYWSLTDGEPSWYIFCGLNGTIAVQFWCLYILAIDLRYNRTPWKNSLSGWILRSLGALGTKGLELPFQKSMVRRYRDVFAPAAAIAVLACIAGIKMIYDRDFGILPFLLLLLLALLAWTLLRYAKDNKELSLNMGALVDQIEAVRNGNLTEPLVYPGDAALAEAAANLNDIQKGMDRALDEKVKSERMKVELISNVSHDIKTPLTSIISYVDLLKKEEDLPAHVKDYIRILDSKSQRLKTMVQDVFEVSKAASGQLPVNQEKLDFGKLLRQTLADMEEQIKNSDIKLRAQIPEEPVYIVADGKRLYRVFQNLIQNALMYSLEGSRLYVSLKEDAALAVASVQNTSRQEILPQIDLTERFVRGDDSRTDGGSGLGLSIARSFTEACGGALQIQPIADLFTVTVAFPREI